MQVQGHEVEVDEAGVGEVEEDDNRDKEEQAMSCTSM